MPATKTHRTADERIAQLKAEIERIKAREAEQKVKKDPARGHLSSPGRSIDNARHVSLTDGLALVTDGK